MTVMEQEMGSCVISEYDVRALGELFWEVVLVSGVILFFQYADKGTASVVILTMLYNI